MKIIIYPTGIVNKIHRSQHGQDDDLVAIGAWASHNNLAPFIGLRLARVQAGLEDLFNLLFSEGINWYFLKLRRGDVQRRIGQLEFFIQPAEEGAEGDSDLRIDLGESSSVFPLKRTGVCWCAARPGNRSVRTM
jgi:hypothetical protein